MDPALCVAADGQNMASTGWCIMNCGLPKPQTNCDAQLCYCSDKQVASAIWPGGDPTTCKGVENAAEDGWCVDNCKDALEKGSNSCPDYLCKCSKPGIKEKAPGTELTLTLTLTLALALALTLTLTRPTHCCGRQRRRPSTRAG